LAIVTKEVLAGQELAAASAKTLISNQEIAASQLQLLQVSQATAFNTAEASLADLSRYQEAAMIELKRDTNELSAKQQVLLRGLEHVLDIQKTLLSHSMDIGSVTFYCCAVVMTWALTAMPRTAPARVPIFGLLFANALIERVLASSSMVELDSMDRSIYLCRGLFICVGGLRLIRTAALHVDIGTRMLMSIHELMQSVDELKEHVSCSFEAKTNATMAFQIDERPRGACHRDEVVEQSNGQPLVRAHGRASSPSDGTPMRASLRRDWTAMSASSSSRLGVPSVPRGLRWASLCNQKD